MKRKKMSLRRCIGIVFLLPAFAFIMYSTIIPGIWSIIMTFQTGNKFNDLKFCGLDNYIMLLSDANYWGDMKNTLLVGVAASVLTVVIGTFLAILIYRVGKFEGSMFRLIFFMPYMLPAAIVGLLFTFIYASDLGLLNNILNVIGLGNLRHAWLAEPGINMWAVIFVFVWKDVGFMMILVSAALQGIPDSFMEAAKLEGANYIQQLYHIIYPLIRPVIRTGAMFTIYGKFKSFDLIYILTKGGPGTISETIPLYTYKQAFTYNNFGYGATVGLSLMVVIFGAQFLNKLIFRGESYEY